MKQIRCFLIIGLLLIVVVSNAQKNRYIKTSTYEGVIFAKYCCLGVEMAKHPSIPTDREIAAMEKRIAYSPE